MSVFDRIFQGVLFGLLLVCLIKNLMQDNQIEKQRLRVDQLILTVQEANR